MKTYLCRAEDYHHFSGLSFIVEVSFWRLLKTVVSCNLFIIIIRKCGSTLYVCRDVASGIDRHPDRTRNLFHIA